MDALTLAVQILVLPAALLTVVELAYVPLSLWSVRRRRPGVAALRDPLVSVVVPAFNEGVVLARCVESILADDWSRKEVILVDDGSTDDTWRIMSSFAGRPGVQTYRQENAGKAVALNRGIAAARGQVMVFVDADGVFSGRTIAAMAAGFDDPRVGAVCGNDAPVNLDRVQPRLLTLLTHVTAMVRRALAEMNCLTIVSGNCGAVRTDVLERIGPFTPGLLGEDLELTWRVRKAGYRVAFRADALVYAEVPSTARSLWRQRVRWSRGYLQTARMHRGAIGNLRYGVLGPYLLLNAMGTVVMPLAQLAALVPAVALLVLSHGATGGPPTTAAGWAALALPLVTVVVATAMNKSLRDLRYAYALVLMPVYSLAMSLALATAVVRELRGAPATWNKFARTGVASRAAGPASPPTADGAASRALAPSSPVPALEQTPVPGTVIVPAPLFPDVATPDVVPALVAAGAEAGRRGSAPAGAARRATAPVFRVVGHVSSPQAASAPAASTPGRHARTDRVPVDAPGRSAAGAEKGYAPRHGRED